MVVLSSIAQGVDAVGFENVGDRGVRDVKAQVGQGALNAVVASTGIFLSHANSQGHDLRPNTWSTDGLSLVRVIPFASDELTMPSEYGVGCDDGGDLLQVLAGEHLTFDGQPSTLIIVEQNATLAEFFFEYVILSSQILNDLL